MAPTILTPQSLAELLEVEVSSNLKSVHSGLRVFSLEIGLGQPQRLVAYLAQLGHESHDFIYDREVWGPTPAQKRYDTRTDLGKSRSKCAKSLSLVGFLFTWPSPTAARSDRVVR